MGEGKICLKTRDHTGETVLFTEKQRKEKAVKRPELRDSSFIHGRVRKAIQSPDFIYADLAKPKKRQALYLEEYTVNGTTRYTKVVLEKQKNHYFVVTVFRPDYVKERGKTKLLYGKDSGNN